MIPWQHGQNKFKTSYAGNPSGKLLRTEGGYPNPKEIAESLTCKSPGPDSILL